MPGLAFISEDGVSPFLLPGAVSPFSDTRKMGGEKS